MANEITIKTDENYKVALSRIDEIMDVEEPDPDEDYEYDKLVIAIQQYEYDYTYITNLKAENAALKKRVAELGEALKKYADKNNCGKDIIYEPLIIEFEEAVIEEAIQKWGEDFNYLEVTIYSTKSCDYTIVRRSTDNQPTTVDPDRFTAIVELWLKIRGM